MRLVAFTALALAALPVWAQRYEVGPYFSFDRMTRTPLGTVRPAGGSVNDTSFRDGKGFGLRLTLNTKGYYGHEVHYVRSQVPLVANVDEYIIDPDGFITLGDPVTRREKIRMSRLGYNFLMYMMPAGEKWRPYLTIGAVTQNTRPPRFLEWTQDGGRNFGFNYGAGIKLMPVNHWMVRLDFRHMYIGRPFGGLAKPDAVDTTAAGSIGQMEFSAGFSYAWGR